MGKGSSILGTMRFDRERSLMRVNGDRAPQAPADPETKGLSALECVTYVSVSDEGGRMDDDLFDLLREEEGLAH